MNSQPQDFSVSEITSGDTLLEDASINYTIEEDILYVKVVCAMGCITGHITPTCGNQGW